MSSASREGELLGANLHNETADRKAASGVWAGRPGPPAVQARDWRDHDEGELEVRPVRRRREVLSFTKPFDAKAPAQAGAFCLVNGCRSRALDHDRESATPIALPTDDDRACRDCAVSKLLGITAG